MTYALRTHTCATCDGSGQLPVRPFIAFWIDEIMGQRSIVVLARDAVSARDTIEQTTGAVCVDIRSL